jgi:hypothetical protein
MATIPEPTQLRPAATCTPTVVRKNGVDDGMGIPRISMPWSVNTEASEEPPNL